MAKKYGCVYHGSKFLEFFCGKCATFIIQINFISLSPVVFRNDTHTCLYTYELDYNQ
jgi:hypothetical protein